MKTVFLILAALSITVTVSAQTVNDPNLIVEKVIPDHSFFLPISMAFIGPDDILVAEQYDGTVSRVISGVVQTPPVLTLPVNVSGERGLLGMALHPDFSNNHYVYVYYTLGTGSSNSTPVANRVSRFTWTGSALTNELTIVDLPVSPGPNHNGGIIKFGPPGLAASNQKLFIVIGDLNRNNQTENYPGGAAADNTAVILRLNPDGTVPSDAEKGPFFDVAGSNSSLKTMYAYGVRNSFGMDFDPITNALWDTENGANDNDEINRVDPGFNSGWETVMGYQNPLPSNLVQFSGVGTYSNPEFTWQSVVAPTAIHFYRGSNMGSEYQYDAFVGCFNSGKLYRFEPNPARNAFTLTGTLADTVLNVGDADSPVVFGQGFGPISDITTGPDGNLYVLTMAPDTPASADMLYRIRSNVNAVDKWELYD